MSPECRRAQEWVSCDVDNELSTFERTLLDRHVESCSSCRTFRTDVATLTDALRSATLAVPERPVVVSKRATRWPVRIAPVAAALAVATVGVGSMLASLTLPGSLQPSRRPPQRVIRYVDRTVSQHKLSAIRKATRTSSASPVDRLPVAQRGQVVPRDIEQR